MTITTEELYCEEREVLYLHKAFDETLVFWVHELDVQGEVVSNSVLGFTRATFKPASG